MPIMRLVQMAVHQVIHMIPMWHRFMPAAVPVHVACGMALASVRRAVVWVLV